MADLPFFHHHAQPRHRGPFGLEGGTQVDAAPMAAAHGRDQRRARREVAHVQVHVATDPRLQALIDHALHRQLGQHALGIDLPVFDPVAAGPEEFVAQRLDRVAVFERILRRLDPFAVDQHVLVKVLHARTAAHPDLLHGAVSHRFAKFDNLAQFGGVAP